MTWKFFKTYEDGDERKQTIISEYDTWEGTTLNETNKGVGSNSLQDGVIPLKYKIESNNAGNQCQTDWIVYRYADVLTLLAEAIVREGNTVTTEAINLLNQVRTRAGLTAYPRLFLCSNHETKMYRLRTSVYYKRKLSSFPNTGISYYCGTRDY